VGGTVSPARSIAAAASVVVAIVLALGAHDALAWRNALVHDRWTAATWLPGDPVRSVLALGDDADLRRAIHAYRVAIATPRGFDNGETQDAVRSAAEVQLSDLAAGSNARAAAQAGTLLGVLVSRAGTVSGGLTADDRAQAAWTAAIERASSQLDARYDLELLLRRTRARSTRHGAGNGTGSQGRGRKGAGSGTPGRGY
jgi:hypothetical protein